MAPPPVLVVFGARNVGRAVVADRLAAGWRALAVARSEETLALLAAAHPEVVAVRADASDPAAVEEVLARAARELGGPDLVVNATTSVPRDHSFGGGPVADAPPERLASWLDGFLPVAWAVLRAGGAALRARGAGTLVQVTGGSARRAMPGRGPWAAAQSGARALTLSLAQELRPAGVHVALLVADGVIQTDRNPMAGRPAADSLAPEDVAAGIAYLAGQRPRGWTHELVITPAGDTWDALRAGDPSLAPRALLHAYAAGAFPMDEEGADGAVRLYEADPRGVMPIAGFRVPRSVARGLRRTGYEIRVDAAFDAVAEACARREDVWLTPRLRAAYGRLHRLGHAHSVEAWSDDELVGGLFGVALRGLFTSETMFHRAPDAGSAALVGAAELVRAGGFRLWDIQMVSPHTRRFGAEEIGRAEYRRRLVRALRAPATAGPLAGAL